MTKISGNPRKLFTAADDCSFRSCVALDIYIYCVLVEIIDHIAYFLIINTLFRLLI